MSSNSLYATISGVIEIKHSPLAKHTEVGTTSPKPWEKTLVQN